MNEIERAIKFLGYVKGYDIQGANLAIAALIDKLQALAENGQSAIDTNMRLVKVVESLQVQLAASQRRAQDARNELCLKCGRYREAHNGACNGCRWKE